MNINVSVDNIDLTSVVGDVRQYDDDRDEYVTEGRTLGDLVAEKVAKSVRESDAYPGLKKRVADIREEEIRALVAPDIEAAMTEPIRKTNHYGKVTGQTTTMRELILDEAQKFMAKPADTYNRDRGTVLQKWVRDAVETTIKTELAEVLKDEKAKVVAAVRAKAADLIAQAVKEGIGRG